MVSNRGRPSRDLFKFFSNARRTFMDKVYCWPAAFPRGTAVSLVAALVFAYGLVLYRGGLVGILDVLSGVLVLLAFSGIWYLTHRSLESEYTNRFRNRILEFIRFKGWSTYEELWAIIPCSGRAKRKISESVIKELVEKALIKSGCKEGRRIYELS